MQNNRKRAETLTIRLTKAEKRNDKKESKEGSTQRYRFSRYNIVAHGDSRCRGHQTAAG